MLRTENINNTKRSSTHIIIARVCVLTRRGCTRDGVRVDTEPYTTTTTIMVIIIT